MRVAIVVFPGSNCDRDVFEAIKSISKKLPKFIWHKETNIENFDLIIIPGGFTFGDYLRCGALASNSPIIKSIRDHASRGGAILGICNGFQILTETKLLPGTLIRNNVLKFLCHDLNVIVQDTLPSPFTWGFKPNTKLNIPIAHNEGNYYINDNELKKLKFNGQIAFKYEENSNPNGSVENIAGVCNQDRNVFGMMPHPERACSDVLGNSDGEVLMAAICNTAAPVSYTHLTLPTTTIV